MTFGDTLGMAFMNLWRRKLRAFLTVLGMVIGTASIIVMVSLGIGINVSYQESLEQAGSLTKITISPQDWNKFWEQQEESGNNMYVTGQPDTVDINDKAIDAIKSIEGVVACTPILSTYNGYIKTGKFITNGSMYGIDPNTAEAFGITLSEGAIFGAGGGATVEMVVGSQFVYSFYNPQNGSQAMNRDGTPRIKPLTDRLRLTFDPNNVYDWGETDASVKKGKFYNIKITGIITEGTDWQVNNGIYMDVSKLKALMRENKSFIYQESGSSTYSEAWVKVDNVENVTKVQEQISAMGFGTSSLGDALKQAQDSSASLRTLLGAIGGVALLVAAIGIMNTMMMAIYERTKEIGVMKVLGCKMSNIRRMFLCESAIIGFFGGLLGMGASYGLGSILNNVFMESQQMRSVIPVWLSLGAVAFSVIVAMVSGLYPSMRAMRLSPLAAIRTE